MICPKCNAEATSVDEHTETPARRLCEPESTLPDKTWLRYKPCGHLVEKPVDLGHQDVETTAATYERAWLNRWVSEDGAKVERAYAPSSRPVLPLDRERIAEDRGVMAVLKALGAEWSPDSMTLQVPTGRHLRGAEFQRRLDEELGR